MSRMDVTSMRTSECCFEGRVAVILLAAMWVTLAWEVEPARAAEQGHACPEGVPAGTNCYSGQDQNGAYYWIAIPEHWNHVLMVHSHGGPSLKTPTPEDPLS